MFGANTSRSGTTFFLVWYLEGRRGRGCYMGVGVGANPSLHNFVEINRVCELEL